GSGNQLSKNRQGPSMGALQSWRTAMEHYVGLDVSPKLTAICIVDRTGKIEREGVVASDPETIAAFVKLHAPNSRLYETGSPRWHRQGSRLSILTEPHDELAGPHSITLSARARTAGGIWMRSDFAILRLMRRSNLVGSTTGSSDGFSPLTMRPA